MEEAEARGFGMVGRLHLGQILAEKGYVIDIRQTFGESAKRYAVEETLPTVRIAALIQR